jgi:hypothetical protein
MEITYMPRVIAGEYISEYKIMVGFSDSTTVEIDFQQFLDGPIFEPLKDINYFRKFILDGWTISWPNGADIAPETLYSFREINKQNVA